MKNFTLVAAFTALAGAADASNRISALDFLVDGKSHRGHRVAIHGCTVIGASASIVMCNVRNRGNQVGNVILDGDSMDRASLRRSLTECSDMMPTKRCEIVEMTGEVRVNGMGDVRLDKASITWR